MNEASIGRGTSRRTSGTWILLLLGALFSSDFLAGSAAWAAQTSYSAGLAASSESVLDGPSLLEGDGFGASLACQGGRAAVGAPGDDGGASGAGAVYLFEQDGPRWGLEVRLQAPESAAELAFGEAVALDGGRLLVGAPGATVGGVEDAGAVFAFERTSGAWSLVATLANPRPSPGARFGATLALRGQAAWVGAPGAEAVHLFIRTAGAWRAEALLAAPPVAAGFGKALAFDGETLLVGAPDSAPHGGWSGAAFVFEERAGTWAEVAALTAHDGHPSQFFGVSVDVEGEVLAVGARGDAQDALWSGAVYTFTRPLEDWRPAAKLKSPQPIMGAHFGSAVALDAEVLAVGARWDSTVRENAGAAYVFRRDDEGWSALLSLVRPDAGDNDWFGAALDLERGELLVGAPRADAPGVDSGAAHLWRVAPGASFCAGDGSAYPCSCANLGGVGRGCQNSSGAGGLLLVEGSAELARRDLAWRASELPGGRAALLLSADLQRAGGEGWPFGDGLQCLDGTQTLLGVAHADAGGAVSWQLAGQPKGRFLPGQTAYFQVLYRDALSGPCGTGFNTTNGYALTFE